MFTTLWLNDRNIPEARIHALPDNNNTNNNNNEPESKEFLPATVTEPVAERSACDRGGCEEAKAGGGGKARIHRGKGRVVGSPHKNEKLGGDVK
ncbi:hypothetical protein BGX20_011176 [Mortierella sp. AD010]|nr:hypothetical protein BGX20_011176 [Mortierella sp. AD010]